MHCRLLSGSPAATERQACPPSHTLAAAGHRHTHTWRSRAELTSVHLAGNFLQAAVVSPALGPLTDPLGAARHLQLSLCGQQLHGGLRCFPSHLHAADRLQAPLTGLPWRWQRSNLRMTSWSHMHAAQQSSVMQL